MDEAEHSVDVEALKSELSQLQHSKAALDSKLKLLESVVSLSAELYYFPVSKMPHADIEFLRTDPFCLQAKLCIQNDQTLVKVVFILCCSI